MQRNKEIASKKMTKNGLDIQTISTKRTDFQTDRVLPLGHVLENKELYDKYMNYLNEYKDQQ